MSRRSEVLQLKLLPAERAAFDKAADAAGVTVTQFIRQCAIAEAERLLRAPVNWKEKMIERSRPSIDEEEE